MKILAPLTIISFILLGFSKEVSSNPSYHNVSDSPYEAIFNFGDSLSDTGNLLASGALGFPVIAKLPYGETFFKHATGRCSDGRLIVDFIGMLSERYQLH